MKKTKILMLLTLVTICTFPTNIQLSATSDKWTPEGNYIGNALTPTEEYKTTSSAINIKNLISEEDIVIPYNVNDDIRMPTLQNLANDHGFGSISKYKMTKRSDGKFDVIVNTPQRWSDSRPTYYDMTSVRNNDTGETGYPNTLRNQVFEYGYSYDYTFFADYGFSSPSGPFNVGKGSWRHRFRLVPPPPDNVVPTYTHSISPTGSTSGTVTITLNASDAHSGLKSIRLPNGTMVNNIAAANKTVTHTVSENGTYLFTLTDNYNNANTARITVSNILKPPPTPPTVRANITTPTNGNVTLTATYPSDAVTRQYKLSTTSTWSNYTAPITVTQNSTYNFRGLNVQGVASAVTNHTVSNIDKTPPVITTSSPPTAWTNQNITVTATTNEGSLNKSSHTFTSNGSYEFVATDPAGNVFRKSVTVSNIDKTPPSNPIINLTGTPFINGEFNLTNLADNSGGSGLKNVTYNITNTQGTIIKDWTSYGIGSTIPITSKERDIVIQAKAFDNAGNISQTTSRIANEVKIDISIPINPLAITIPKDKNNSGVDLPIVNNGTPVELSLAVEGEDSKYLLTDNLDDTYWKSLTKDETSTQGQIKLDLTEGKIITLSELSSSLGTMIKGSKNHKLHYLTGYSRDANLKKDFKLIYNIKSLY